MFTRLLETLRQYQPSVTKQASLLKDLILSRFHEKLFLKSFLTLL